MPTSKVIAELTQITSEPGRKLKIIRCNLVGAQSCFQTSVTHVGRESSPHRRSADSCVRTLRVKPSRRNIIRDREWIERILDRHADAIAAYSEWMCCIREYIRRKRNRRPRVIPEPAHVLEVGEEFQIWT